MKKGLKVVFQGIYGEVIAPGIPEEYQGFPIPEKLPHGASDELINDFMEKLEKKAGPVDIDNIDELENVVEFSFDDCSGRIQRYTPQRLNEDCNERIGVYIDYRKYDTSDIGHIQEYEGIARLVEEWETAGEKIMKGY
ncbi:hypothetical protein GOV11_02380 [Candidatus Woesearchaeota archaeon]|nr:hypothetical protein [Candidatus Woesearchaeota archaeon]